MLVLADMMSVQFFFAVRSQGSRPCTLHPIPYTLHPAPYTLHPTPCTPRYIPYTSVSLPTCVESRHPSQNPEILTGDPALVHIAKTNKGKK